MRTFNVAGPCRADKHYLVPPESRTPDLDWLFEKEAWFVVHAPRQSGKTTAMKALAERLTREGRYAALHFSCESARTFRDDVGRAERQVWQAILEAANQQLPEDLRPPPAVFAEDGGFLMVQLRRWAERCPRPLVLIFDEIDALEGDALRNALSQLRSAYANRPGHFPSSIVLCGMKDVRDYKIAGGSAAPVQAGSSSPFNILEKSLRLPNFTEQELGELYAQHTRETGQPFTEDAISLVWSLSQGQPWLCNALAREVVEEMGIRAPEPITAAHIETAKDRLIATRATHLDSLLARLKEDRVRSVLEPIIAGELPYGDPLDDDYTYVRDLGLIAVDEPPRFANQLYEEVVLRVLAGSAERAVVVRPSAFLLSDGRLDSVRMLQDFLSFWRENGEILSGRMPYPEAAPLLVMMAWLLRFTNGAGGVLEREIGVGSKRMDLLLRWPYREPSGAPAWQRLAFELKVWRDRDKRRDPATEGLVQLDGYLSRLGLDQGILVVFDARTGAAPMEDRCGMETLTSATGREVVLVRA